MLGFVRVCAADMSSLTILHLLTKYKISQILPSQFSDNHHLPQLQLTAQVELPAKKRNWGEFAVNALSKGLSNGFQSYDEEVKKFFEDKPEEEKDQKGKGMPKENKAKRL